MLREVDYSERRHNRVVTKPPSRGWHNAPSQTLLDLFPLRQLLSVAIFRKDISDEIIPAPTKIHKDFSYLGQTYDRFEVNTTTNAETADVNGVELTFADRFAFLPSPLEGWDSRGR